MGLQRRIAFGLLAALLLAGCEEPDDGLIYGYAEGRFRLLAPTAEGRLTAVLAAAGEEVAAGAVVARLDDSVEKARLAEAEAHAAAARERYADAAKGGREAEVQAARDVLAQAEASAKRTADDLERIRSLFRRGVVARAQLDAAEAAAQEAASRVAEQRQRLALVEMPARENALRALAADRDAAAAAVDATREALARRQVEAPEAGRIERVLREAGEMAGPNAPFVRYLPAGAMMAIGFVPEPDLGAYRLGDRLAVACDGCAEGLVATVSSISEDAAFTAPAIFSDRERARLVFRLEARFAPDAAAPPSGAPLRLRRLP